MAQALRMTSGGGDDKRNERRALDIHKGLSKQKRGEAAYGRQFRDPTGSETLRRRNQLDYETGERMGSARRKTNLDGMVRDGVRSLFGGGAQGAGQPAAAATNGAGGDTAIPNQQGGYTYFPDPELDQLAQLYGPKYAQELDRLRRMEESARNAWEVQEGLVQQGRESQAADLQLRQAQRGDRAMSALYGDQRDLGETYGAGARRDEQGNVVIPARQGGEGRMAGQAVDESGAFTGRPAGPQRTAMERGRAQSYLSATQEPEDEPADVSLLKFLSREVTGGDMQSAVDIWKRSPGKSEAEIRSDLWEAALRNNQYLLDDPEALAQKEQALDRIVEQIKQVRQRQGGGGEQGGEQVIPQGAIQALIDNPDKAEEFDRKYGSGAAAQILNGQ